MTDDTKQEISIVLDLLKGSLVRNGVSMGFDKVSHSLVFFDTNTYLESKKMDGFRVKLEDLVR